MIDRTHRMTKGEAYKRYYEANKERILEAARERGRLARERRRDAEPKVRDDFLTKDRTLRYKRRKNSNREELQKHAETCVAELRPFYTTFTQMTNLDGITPKMLDVLLNLRLPENNVVPS